MRFIPSLTGKLVFNSISMFAIWTIIMTYFGVNYYLSGLHSYAAGNPIPIPVFIKYLLGLMVVTAFLAKIKQYDSRKREEIITFMLICLILNSLFYYNLI